MKLRSNQTGFTMVELLVAIGAGSIVALAVLSISLFFFADMMAANAETELTLEAQAINRITMEDMRIATRVESANVLTDSNEPTGGWNTSSPDHILIISRPAVDSLGDFIFDTSSGEPYQNEIIYFEEEGNLYKRILANSSATGNIAQTTCPEAVATASCPPDRLLTTHFSSMSFSFFDQDNNSTTDISLARSIDISLGMQRSVYGRNVTASNEVRVTLRNPT